MGYPEDGPSEQAVSENEQYIQRDAQSHGPYVGGGVTAAHYPDLAGSRTHAINAAENKLATPPTPLAQIIAHNDERINALNAQLMNLRERLRPVTSERDSGSTSDQAMKSYGSSSIVNRLEIQGVELDNIILGFADLISNIEV